MFTTITVLPCRRSVEELDSTEKSALVAAIKAVKSSGDYDSFVTTHQNAMDQETPPGTATTTRNAAHRGPAFLPWHREFLFGSKKSCGCPTRQWRSRTGIGQSIPLSGTRRMEQSGGPISWVAMARR